MLKRNKRFGERYWKELIIDPKTLKLAIKPPKLT